MLRTMNASSIQIFGRTQTLARQPILEVLSVLRRLGFDGVELCLENPDLAPQTLNAETARRVGARCDELGMARSVSWHKDFIHDELMLHWTKAAIRMTPSFGARLFVYAGAPPRGEPSADWETLVTRTRELVAVAEEAGVTLAQEFEPGFIVGSTDELCRLLDAVPSASLQVNLDLGHVFLCDPDPFAAIARLRGRIVHCHVENMARGVHRHLPPWEGDMDLRAYLRALNGIGFEGPLALDLYDADYEAVGARAVRFLRGCLEHRAGEGGTEARSTADR